MVDGLVEAVRNTLRKTVLRTISVIPLLLVAALGHAQSDREGTWEVGGTLLDLSSVDLSGPEGSALYVDDETGFGMTAAYNFTNHFAVGFDLTYADPAYVATIVPDGIGLTQTIDAELGVNVIHFKGIINILDRDLTPFAEFGAGWTYIDSNIIDDVYSGGICWWDPWWGYVCPTYYDTYTDTRTSYSYALGLRWDIDSNILFKASWGVVNVDTNRGTEDIELDSIQATVAWRF